MKTERLNRLNELARKAKGGGLSKAETAEREVLRQEYRDGIKSNLSATLENCVIVEPDGTKRPVRKQS